MSAYFVKRLKEIKSSKIKEIRSKGLLIGVEFRFEGGETVRPICEKLMARVCLRRIRTRRRLGSPHRWS